MESVWKAKYEKLKAENDRKTMTLASLATSSVLTVRSKSRENSMGTLRIGQEPFRK